MDKWILVVGAVLVLAIGAVLVNWLRMRRNYTMFTQQICEAIDCIINHNKIENIEFEQETLSAKIQMRLRRLSEITEAALEESETQKQAVQSVVSDISHQLKTPIANITMYCDTVLQQELPEETRQQCLEIMDKQVKKLEFLTQSLLKMSRLENEIIALHPEQNQLQDTLYEVTESIRPKAEQKKIALYVSCPQEISLWYDVKWTAEAIFNVVDNAVKYTPEEGTIRISVEPLEIYTKIIVEDNGIGIAPEHINDVCKRFFREDKASRTEGVGIGLYLSREIIMKQNGYMMIVSEEGAGTQVCLYLLNRLG